MPTLSYIGRPVVAEPWIQDFRDEVARTELAGMVDLACSDTLREESLSRFEVSHIGFFEPDLVRAVSAGLSELRARQPACLEVETKKILIRKRSLLLGLASHPVLEEDREQALKLVGETFGLDYPEVDYRFNVRLGTMRDTSNEAYRKTIYRLTDTVMPQTVQLARIKAEMKSRSGKRFKA